MIENPCRVQIRTPQAVAAPRLGGAFDLVVGAVPLGNPNPSESASVRGRACLYLQPHEGPTGNYWWLVTVAPTVNGTWLSEEQARRSVLNVEGDHAGELVDLGEVRVGLWWRRGGRCRMIRAGWGKRVMERLWEREGNPEEEGLALAGRLLPRLLEGALRDMEPETVIQVWAKL